MRWLVPTDVGDVAQRPAPDAAVGERVDERIQQIAASLFVRRSRHRGMQLLARAFEALVPRGRGSGGSGAASALRRRCRAARAGRCAAARACALRRSAVTSWVANAVRPASCWRHVHEMPGSTSVTSQTSVGIRGCLISNRLPTSIPGPSRATMRSIDAVHSDQRSTSVNTSHTTDAGASISMLLSVIMYQMVHNRGRPVHVTFVASWVRCDGWT